MTPERRASGTAAWVVACLALFGAVALLAPAGRDARAAAERLAQQNRELVGRLAEAETAAAEVDAAGVELSGVRAALDDSRRRRFLTHVTAAAEALAEERWSDLERHLDAVPDEHLGWEWFHLAARRELAIGSSDFHDAPVELLCRAAGAAVTASCDADGVVHVAEVDGREPLATLALEERPATLALDASGLRLAVAWDSGEVAVLDARDGRELGRTSIAAAPTALAFGPGGVSVVVGDRAGAVALWTPGDGPPRELGRHGDAVTALAVAPVGGALASASRDATVQLHRGGAGGSPLVLQGHADWVQALAFDPAGERLASGGDDRLVIVRSAADGAELERLETAGGPVVALALTGRDGLAWVGEDGVGALHAGRATTRVDLALGEHDVVLAAAFAPDGARLVHSTGGAELLTWRRGGPSGAVRYPTGGSAVDSVAESDDGELLAAGGFDGSVHVFERESRARRHALDLSGEAVRALSFAPDGGRLAAATDAGELVLLDPRGGEVLRRRELSFAPAALAFSADGASLLVVGRDGAAQIVDAASCEPTATQPGPPGLVFGATAGAAARHVVWVGDGGTVRGFDVATGRRVAALRDRELGRIEALALSADERALALIENGLALVVLDLEAGQRRARGFVPDRSLRAVAVDPLGERVATGSYHGHVGVWDARSGSLLVELRAGPSAVRAIAFSPDGDRLLVGTERGLDLWGGDAEPVEAALRAEGAAR